MKLKSIMAILALAIFAAMGWPAARGTLTCAGPDGRACTQEHVRRLLAATHTINGGPQACLLSVKTISLSSGGTLLCEQKGGRPCTVDQARSLYRIGRAINLTVRGSGAR